MTHPNFAYFEGEIVPYSKAKVGVATHALNYGTGAFGGVRGYWNEDEEQLFVFRPIDHFKRLLNSGKLLRATYEHTPEDLTAITLELLRKEAYRQDCYIRPLIYKADEKIGVRLHDLKDEITIFSIPFTRYIENDENASVGFSSWQRVDDNAIPARGKITGSYINSALIKSDAMLSGFDEALVLNQNGHVSEGSAENIFMVRNGKLITPSVTENILEGITRRTIMMLAQDELGLEVQERAIDRTEVYVCDEFFMTGTAAQVTAITKIDNRPVADGKMGSITAQLKQMYDDLVRGRIEKFRYWNEPVYVREPAKS
ncbi:MAG TPA: branched-chain amino acid transaminase [Anaerolineae bacterium]|nr:branched-chain amino acid transaminase [Anaerolineae bacterium]